ncbi:MAG: DUF899 family protein [Deltaproteobacteria bacterium]|nr:DUF899 family protein [Deltaproteobacteria bacterium]
MPTPRYCLSQESADYRHKRQELLDAEIALRDQRERVAELRRQLPRDTVVEDQWFEEVDGSGKRSIQLSELFADPQKPLVLMHFMFGKQQTRACPSCTAWADGYSGVGKHLSQRVNFAVLVAGDVHEFKAFADGRGWGGMRLVSAAESTLKQDLGVETPDGGQEPGVSVFTLEGGEVRHVYTGGAIMDKDTSLYRGMDLLSPIWHFLDLTPDGRGDWLPELAYDG